MDYPNSRIIVRQGEEKTIPIQVVECPSCKKHFDQESSFDWWLDASGHPTIEHIQCFWCDTSNHYRYDENGEINEIDEPYDYEDFRLLEEEEITPLIWEEVKQTFSEYETQNSIDIRVSVLNGNLPF